MTGTDIPSPSYGLSLVTRLARPLTGTDNGAASTGSAVR